MARLLTVASLILLTIGLIVRWPLIRAAMQYRVVRGHVIEVFTIPAGGQQVKMFIAYEYPLPGPGKNIALGYAQADENLQLLEDDHIVPAADADGWQRALFGRNVSVYYDVNHPIDSAFMISPIRSAHGLRPEHGMLMIILGIVCGILGQIARRRR